MSYHIVNTIQTSFLTKKGQEAFAKESTKWDIIRTFHLQHTYSQTACDLHNGDYVYGPSFNGWEPNIFKFIISGWNCQFEPIASTQSNVQKVRKDVVINDFAWFKLPTGKYF